jgi:hypothetical protein
MGSPDVVRHCSSPTEVAARWLLCSDCAEARAAGSRRRVPLATPEECASGSCPQRAVSGPDSARRRIPRLAPATGVLPPSPKGFGGPRFSDEAGKGRADESPPRVPVNSGGGLHPDYSRVAGRCGALAPEDPVEQAVTNMKNVAEACDRAWGWGPPRRVLRTMSRSGVFPACGTGASGASEPQRRLATRE